MRGQADSSAHAAAHRRRQSHGLCCALAPLLTATIHPTPNYPDWKGGSAVREVDEYLLSFSISGEAGGGGAWWVAWMGSDLGRARAIGGAGMGVRCARVLTCANGLYPPPPHTHTYAQTHTGLALAFLLGVLALLVLSCAFWPGDEDKEGEGEGEGNESAAPMVGGYACLASEPEGPPKGSHTQLIAVAEEQREPLLAKGM